MTAPIRSDRNETLSERYFRVLLAVTDDPRDRERIKKQAEAAGHGAALRKPKKKKR